MKFLGIEICKIKVGLLVRYKYQVKDMNLAALRLKDLPKEFHSQADNALKALMEHDYKGYQLVTFPLHSSYALCQKLEKVEQ